MSPPQDHDGCVRWFANLVHSHGYELRAFCGRHFPGRPALADEALQSTFLVAWQKRTAFTWEKPRALLYSIAKLEIYAIWRKEGPLTPVHPDTLLALLDDLAKELELPDASEDAASAEHLEAMQGCLKRLEALEARIVELRSGLAPCDLWDLARRGPTWEEVTKVLETEYLEPMSSDQVRMKFTRALAKLFKCIRQKLFLAEAVRTSTMETEVQS